MDFEKIKEKHLDVLSQGLPPGARDVLSDAMNWVRNEGLSVQDCANLNKILLPMVCGLLQDYAFTVNATEVFQAVQDFVVPLMAPTISAYFGFKDSEAEAYGALFHVFIAKYSHMVVARRTLM
jgi:hypothetical protein